MSTGTITSRGYTPREFGRTYRLGHERVLAMIRRGELGAIDTGDPRTGRHRYVILPRHAEEWERRRAVAEPPKPARRRKRTTAVDYYPD